MAHVILHFDPVCPFAWMTAKWLRMVQAERGDDIGWRLISLRLLNADVDYDSRFPAGYEAGHTAGLRMLRVAAAARDAHGPAALDRLQHAFGQHVFEVPAEQVDPARLGTAPFVAAVLADADLPGSLADALDEEAWDAVIQAETDEALALAGRDVGTPILRVRTGSDDGEVAFFGPVISRLPAPEQAVELWDHVVALARFPGFAELKRSLRELPQLPALGVAPDDVGATEDWHQGSRRQQR